MLFFGHAGLTSGISYLASRVRHIRKIDYRFVLIGALLPDIIDKPLDMLVLHWGNGRLIAHTLIFALALTAIALYKKDMRFYALSGGTWVHLLLDSIWLMPITLFWPFLGAFQHGHSTLQTIFGAINQPYNLIGELSGFAVLLYLAIKSKMYKKSNIIKFFKTGEIG